MNVDVLAAVCAGVAATASLCAFRRSRRWGVGGGLCAAACYAALACIVAVTQTWTFTVVGVGGLAVCVTGGLLVAERARAPIAGFVPSQLRTMWALMVVVGVSIWVHSVDMACWATRGGPCILGCRTPMLYIVSLAIIAGHFEAGAILLGYTRAWGEFLGSLRGKSEVEIRAAITKATQPRRRR